MMKKVVSVNRSPHGSAGHGLFWTNGFGLIRGFSFNQSPDGAIDYNFNKPEPVYASFDGKVTKTKYMHRSSYGRGAGVLWITGDDRQTGAIYAHITFAQGIKKGTVVKRGQIIGTIAPKCASSAVDQCVDFRGSIHLHFQFYALDSSNQIRGFTKSELLKLFPIR